MQSRELIIDRIMYVFLGLFGLGVAAILFIIFVFSLLYLIQLFGFLDDVYAKIISVFISIGLSVGLIYYLLENVNQKYFDKYLGGYIFIPLSHHVEFLIDHDLYQDLDYIMGKFLIVAKFILGCIFIAQAVRCLYHLYNVTSQFIYIQTSTSYSSSEYDKLVAYGWILGNGLFWLAVWLGLFLLVRHFDYQQQIIERVAKREDD